MKRVLLTAIFTAATLSAADQYEMIIHQKGSKTTYLTTAVDSITFVKKGGVIEIPSGMVAIPGGTFLRENTLTITISPLVMSKHEITQAEYESTMKTNPSSFKGATLPVERVTWFDAVLYCNARSKVEKKDTVYTYTGTPTIGSSGEVTGLTGIAIDYSKNGYRLPTEAEWEYACRGGIQLAHGTDDGTISTSKANYAISEINKTTAVGSYPANPFGLYDMSGNVWEWCNDWYDTYNSSAVVNPMGAVSGSGRVNRGGSWNNYAYDLSSGYRYNYDPAGRYYNIGFRVCVSSGL